MGSEPSTLGAVILGGVNLGAFGAAMGGGEARLKAGAGVAGETAGGVGSLSAGAGRAEMIRVYSLGPVGIAGDGGVALGDLNTSVAAPLLLASAGALNPSRAGSTLVSCAGVFDPGTERLRELRAEAPDQSISLSHAAVRSPAWGDGVSVRG